jgi:hypothetical protein
MLERFQVGWSWTDTMRKREQSRLHVGPCLRRFYTLLPRLAHVFQELISQASIGQKRGRRAPLVHVTRPRLRSPLQPYQCPCPLPMNAHLDKAASAHLWDMGVACARFIFRCRCSPTRPGSGYSNPQNALMGLIMPNADATA